MVTMFKPLTLSATFELAKLQEKEVNRRNKGPNQRYTLPIPIYNPKPITTVSSTFQGLMNELFKPYLRKFVLMFLDDILIYSKTLQDHLQHLAIVLELLKSHQLFAKAYKCIFGSQEVEYL